jgi:hypothetical protein
MVLQQERRLFEYECGQRFVSSLLMQLLATHLAALLQT